MKLGVPKETFPGERRVAIVPAVIPILAKLGIDVVVERDAGSAAGFPDAQYVEQKAVIGSRADVFQADIVAQVRTPGANPAEAQLTRQCIERPARHRICGSVDGRGRGSRRGRPGRDAGCYGARTAHHARAEHGRAVVDGHDRRLQSRASGGHRAAPDVSDVEYRGRHGRGRARVFVIGAGVAGLQAIATAKRLGARVDAYDVRPAVKEQIQSLGGRFVEMPIEAGDAQDAGGYAKAQDENFIASSAS